MNSVSVVGGGLAGCEAALQLARRGVDVTLYEMKPARFSPAHRSPMFAELVCSNSLKSMKEDSAPYLLKWEMEQLGSIVMESARCCAVPAGGALSVDREAFSGYITERIEHHPHIRVIREELTHLPKEERAIIATGPLTSAGLYREITDLVGESLYFYDAAAPIVDGATIDLSRAYFQGRYDQDADYLNCPMTKEEYDAFYDALVSAQTAPLSEEDQKVVHFEGCMPIEAMAKRGRQTPLFGPMSPKGIYDPVTDKRPYAVVQLRREDQEGTMFNLVGFQTNLTFPEQRRVFRMIPALSEATFFRYGVMHRNTFLHSPSLLDERLRLKCRPNLSFAGQITGVEGYVESAACGILAGIFAAHEVLGKLQPEFPHTTGHGALLRYVTAYGGSDFQPMNMNFGILPLITGIKGKRERHQAAVQRGKEDLLATMERYQLWV